MSKITIKDVAKASGYSISTVSNAINNVNVIKPKTREHILKVAKELNYVPNINGKLLKAKESKMIGFFTSSVSGPYFYKLVETMAKEVELAGYGLNIFVISNRDIVMNHIIGGNIDGVILFVDQWLDDEIVNLMKRMAIPSVFLDRELAENNMASVTFDSYNAGYEATKYLLNLGNRNIVYINGIETMYDNINRRKGYKDALREVGIDINRSESIEGFFEEGAAFLAVKQYLKKNLESLPHAFLAANDLSAVGAIKAIQSEGLSVPEDIQVMGFDDIDIAKYYTPSLTTVSNPIIKQGKLAIDKLIKMLSNQSATSEKIEGEIIVRKSTTIRLNS